MAKLNFYISDKSLLEKINIGEKTSVIKDILVDADALVALAKSDDSNHQKAIKIKQKLQKLGVSFYISPFTIAETVTVLSHKVSHTAAKKFLLQIRKTSLPVLVLPEKSSNLADNWFLKQNKKGTSFFDCYNMALMKHYNKQIEAIFSFDKIYLKNSFTLAENLPVF